MEFYDELKAEITKRHEERCKECVNIDDPNHVKLVQGAARELGSLLDIIELMENPIKEDEFKKEA